MKKKNSHLKKLKSSKFTKNISLLENHVDFPDLVLIIDNLQKYYNYRIDSKVTNG